MRRKIATVLVAAFAAFLVVGVSGAGAFVGPSSYDPLKSPICLAGGCKITTPIDPNVGGYFTHADTGVDIPDAFTAPAFTTTEVSTEGGAYADLLQGAEVLPKYRWVGVLSDITLATTAFAAGWTIGSTLNEKWLHIQGVGLGTTASVPAATTALHWIYKNPAGTTGPGVNVSPFVADDFNSSVTIGRAPAGWYLYGTNTGCGTSNVPLQIFTTGAGALGTPSCWESASIAAVTAMGSLAQFVNEGAITGSSSANFNRANMVYIPEAAITTAVKPDQPLQNYTGQTSTMTTAWPTPGGQGDTTTASTAIPTSGNPQFCAFQGGQMRCNTNTTTAFPPFNQTDPITIPSGTGSGSASPTDCMRTLVDPTDFTCSGLINPTETMPTVAGDKLSTAESLITQAFLNGHWSAPAFTIIIATPATSVPQYGPGAVITTSPAPQTTITSPAPATVTITINPDPLPLVVLQPQPWETGSDYAARLTAAGLQPLLVPVSPADPTHGPNEVLTPPWSLPAPYVVLQPGTVVTPTDTIPVPVNPDSATAPPGDPNAGGGTSTCNCPALDFSPLSTIGLGNKFPFGIFTYAAGIIGDFNVTAHAPDFNLRAQATGVNGHNLDAGYDVNLGDTAANRVGTQLNTYMGWWRDLLSFAMWVGALYWIGAKLLGFNGAGDPGGSVDEVL